MAGYGLAWPRGCGSWLPVIVSSADVSVSGPLDPVGTLAVQRRRGRRDGLRRRQRHRARQRSAGRLAATWTPTCAWPQDTTSASSFEPRQPERQRYTKTHSCRCE